MHAFYSTHAVPQSLTLLSWWHDTEKASADRQVYARTRTLIHTRAVVPFLSPSTPVSQQPVVLTVRRLAGGDVSATNQTMGPSLPHNLYACWYCSHRKRGALVDALPLRGGALSNALSLTSLPPSSRAPTTVILTHKLLITRNPCRALHTNVLRFFFRCYYISASSSSA